MKKGKAMIVSLAVCMGLLAGCGSTGSGTDADSGADTVQGEVQSTESGKERKNAILHLPSEPISPGFPHREWFRSWQRNLKRKLVLR